MKQLALNIRLDDSSRFDNYFSSGNRQLVTKLKDLPCSTEDFIFVWGSNNSGKSHLAQALCREIFEKQLTAAYFPLNNPQLEPPALEGLEFAELVCLDNFEFIIGQPEWEEAIFNLYNALKIKKRQFIIFSESSPQSMGFKLADLKSRITSMEIYKLNRLSDEQRVDFLISAAKNQGLEITLEVAQFLLARISREVSDLVNMIKTLDTQSLAHQRKITIPFVKSVLDL
jgi:DnaA-homolog protein